MRVPFDTMQEEFKRVFVKAGLSEAKAEVCARVHTETSRDGVYSHGLNRVPLFVEYVKKGWINVDAEPELVVKTGAMENYDGNRGPGILNALYAVNRAAELAKEHAIGIVSMRNTTHWMRGGTYGWEAAEKGVASICWTNTESFMPAWGGVNPVLGNNPLVIAIPRKDGHILMDMAIAQYSNGAIQIARTEHKSLPFPGGFDTKGNLTCDPAEIETTGRILPIGYWKGTSLAMMLDVFAAIFANGLTTAGLNEVQRGKGTGCSQIFIAINPYAAGNQDFVENTLNNTIAYIKDSEITHEGVKIFYPGEPSVAIQQENMEKGIPVDEAIWNQVLKM